MGGAELEAIEKAKRFGTKRKRKEEEEAEVAEVWRKSTRGQLF